MSKSEGRQGGELGEARQDAGAASGGAQGEGRRGQKQQRGEGGERGKGGHQATPFQVPEP